MHTYQLPDLPYDFKALEPVISAEIMELHYKKHHQGYVTNLNAALEKYHEAESKNDVSQMVALQSAIKFNGGGHINHSIFWTILAPVSSGMPKGELAKMIERDFGSFDVFKEKLIKAASSEHCRINEEVEHFHGFIDDVGKKGKDIEQQIRQVISEDTEIESVIGEIEGIRMQHEFLKSSNSDPNQSKKNPE